jgi:hypothetical protein
MIDPARITQLMFESIDDAVQQAGLRARQIERVAMDTLVGN